MVPAGEEWAPKRSPQSEPQALPCFWPRASFPRAESVGVSVFGKRVVRPSWWVCFPQDVPGPSWCCKQRGAGEETAVRPSRPSAAGPAHIERTHLCGDAEMPRGAWKRDGSHAPGSGDPPTLLPKGHLGRGPRVSTGGKRARRQPHQQPGAGLEDLEADEPGQGAGAEGGPQDRV